MTSVRTPLVSLAVNKFSRHSDRTLNAYRLRKSKSWPAPCPGRSVIDRYAVENGDRRHMQAFRPVLDALRDDCARYFGVPSVELQPFEPAVRRFSTVLKVQVQGGRFSSCVFVKIHTPQRQAVDERDRLRRRVTEEFSIATRVRAHFAAHSGLSAVRPIAAFPDHLAIVMEEAPGETLLRLLARRASWMPQPRTVDQLCRITHDIGRWLRVFQRLDVPGRRLSLDAMREYIDVRLVMLVRSRRAGFSAADRSAILRFFDEQSRGVAGDRLEEVLIHADLSLSNVLVDETTVTVIDFGEPKYDAAHHDLTHLYMQLGLLAAKPQFSRGVIQRLQASLLTGFDRDLDPDEPMFRLLWLKHALCHYATLATRGARPAERIYNWHLQRQHRRWVGALLEGKASRRPSSNDDGHHRAARP